MFLDGSKKAYFKEFKKIVETAGTCKVLSSIIFIPLSDVILEVLDARDPLGCRCPDVEQKILQKDPNKKIILVMNKIGKLYQLLIFLCYSNRSHSQR